MARIRIDQGAKVRLAQSLGASLVARTARQVLTGARRLAPTGDHMSGSGRRKRGRPLQPSLRATMNIGTRHVRSRIGSSVRHAATVHQGSKPHIIRGKGKMLKFRWERGDAILRVRGRRGGGFFYFHKVRHPGNKRPVRYLTTPLAMFGRLNGFRVTTVGVNRTRLP